MTNENVQTMWDNWICKVVWKNLEEVKDPEIPVISICELGMVHDVHCFDGVVQVELLPTFVGCPALEFIGANVRKQLAGVEGVTGVDVSFVLTTPWTSDRITPQGIEKLRRAGIAAPVTDPFGKTMPACPYCGGNHSDIENLFGPTACRSIFYCNQCRQPFEAMKRV